jgi:hypothetical protein
MNLDSMSAGELGDEVFRIFGDFEEWKARNRFARDEIESMIRDLPLVAQDQADPSQTRLEL